jgi:predicted molibdopterin-dependent oxidoreductase YjgC
MSLSNCNSILTQLQELIGLTNAGLFMPNQFGNLKGLLTQVKVNLIDDVYKKIADGNIDLLYLIGDVPFEAFPNVKYLIYQSAFPTSIAIKPNVILPTAIWGETIGSYTNTDCVKKNITSSAEKQGYALSHQDVFYGIMNAMKADYVQFSDNNINQKGIVRPEIITPEIPNSSIDIDISLPKDDRFPFTLIREITPHKYYNLDLSKSISAFGELVKTGCVMLNPRDARKLELEEGNSVTLYSPDNEEQFNITISKNISQGFLYLVTTDSRTCFKNNPCNVNIRRDNV